MATLYRVLRELSDRAGTYQPISDVEAASAEAAIRKLVEDPGRQTIADGTYVAVPARSWTEQSVAVESKPRVVLSDPPPRPKLVSPPAQAKAATADSG